MSDNSKQPLVSVLMTVYNGMPYLKEAIEGVQKQTYKHWELVVVDDQSEDDSLSYLRSLDDKRIVVLENGRMGRGKALNYGLKHCRGEYVAINDSDDISLPERIAKQVEFMESNPDYGLIGSHSYLYDYEKNEKRQHSRPLRDEEIRLGLTRGQPLQHVTVLFRRELLDKIKGYNEQIQFLFDRDIFLRVAQFSKMANLKDCLVQVGHHPNRHFYYSFKGLQRELMSLRYRIKAIKQFGFSKTLIAREILMSCWGMTIRTLRKIATPFYHRLFKAN